MGFFTSLMILVILIICFNTMGTLFSIKNDIRALKKAQGIEDEVESQDEKVESHDEKIETFESKVRKTK